MADLKVFSAGVAMRLAKQAVEAGVFGGPFYIVRESDERFWGQDRLEFLDRHLASL